MLQTPGLQNVKIYSETQHLLKLFVGRNQALIMTTVRHLD